MSVGFTSLQNVCDRFVGKFHSSIGEGTFVESQVRHHAEVFCLGYLNQMLWVATELGVAKMGDHKVRVKAAVDQEVCDTVGSVSVLPHAKHTILILSHIACPNPAVPRFFIHIAPEAFDCQ